MSILWFYFNVLENWGGLNFNNGAGVSQFVFKARLNRTLKQFSTPLTTEHRLSSLASWLSFSVDIATMEVLMSRKLGHQRDRRAHWQWACSWCSEQPPVNFTSQGLVFPLPTMDLRGSHCLVFILRSNFTQSPLVFMLCSLCSGSREGARSDQHKEECVRSAGPSPISSFLV